MVNNALNWDDHTGIIQQVANKNLSILHRGEDLLHLKPDNSFMSPMFAPSRVLQCHVAQVWDCAESQA